MADRLGMSGRGGPNCGTLSRDGREQRSVGAVLAWNYYGDALPARLL